MKERERKKDKCEDGKELVEKGKELDDARGVIRFQMWQENWPKEQAWKD